MVQPGAALGCVDLKAKWSCLSTSTSKRRVCCWPRSSVNLDQLVEGGGGEGERGQLFSALGIGEGVRVGVCAVRLP